MNLTVHCTYEAEVREAADLRVYTLRLSAEGGPQLLVRRARRSPQRHVIELCPLSSASCRPCGVRLGPLVSGKRGRIGGGLGTWLWCPLSALDAFNKAIVKATKAALWMNEHWSFVVRKIHKSSDILDSPAPATNFAQSEPVIIMPKSTTLSLIGAVFRRKRDPAQVNRLASIGSNESVEAPTLPYFLEGPLITPGGTPGWANQPWHYVFNVSAFRMTSNDH